MKNALITGSVGLIGSESVKFLIDKSYRNSNISVLEAIEKIEGILGKKAIYEYVETSRSGDHICYISDISKFKNITPYGITDII